MRTIQFNWRRMLIQFSHTIAIGSSSTDRATAILVGRKFAQPTSRGNKLLHYTALIWVHVEPAVRRNLEELRRGTGTGQCVGLGQNELAIAVSQRRRGRAVMASVAVAVGTVYLITSRFQFVFQVGDRRRVHRAGRERKSGIVRVGRRKAIIVGIAVLVALPQLLLPSRHLVDFLLYSFQRVFGLYSNLPHFFRLDGWYSHVRYGKVIRFRSDGPI